MLYHKNVPSKTQAYRNILASLYSSEAGKRIRTGTIVSFPIPSQNEQGELIDVYFLHTQNSDGLSIRVKQRVGIQSESGQVAFYQDLQDTGRLDFSTLSFDLLDNPTPRPIRRRSSDFARKRHKALVLKYETLYPKIRKFAFSQLLTRTQQKQLNEYFHVQTALFGNRMEHYRETSPAFYSWMIQNLTGSFSFLELCRKAEAKLSQVGNFLAMAADDAERQRLLGLSDHEFQAWKEHGSNMLRTILSGRILNADFTQFTNYADPALIAARSYAPNTAAGKKKHSERRELVRQIARQVIAEYELTLPVDLEALAQQLNIRIAYRELEDHIDGFVKMDAEGELITINTHKRYPARRRFTLAHELGHVLIPWHTGTTQCSTDNPAAFTQDAKKIDFQEDEANIFASELLIPSDWLRKRKKSAKKLERLLINITGKTKASVMACLYALEPMLDPGEVIHITSEAMGYGKAFHPADAASWKVGCKDLLPVLEATARSAESFELKSYQIRHYRMLPCPQADELAARYDACGRDLGALLQDITDSQPQQALHCLNQILSALPEKHYVFLEPFEGRRPVYCHPPKYNIHLPKEIKEYDSLMQWLAQNHPDYGQLLLPEGRRLTWVRES